MFTQLIGAIVREGTITIVEPDGRRRTLGSGDPNVTVRVHDRAALNAALERGGIPASSSKGATIVGPQIALGTTLVFD